MGPDPDPGHPSPPGGRSLRPAPPGAILLRELASLYGIQLSFTDRNERRIRAPRESVLAVLRALGAPIGTIEDVPAAMRARQQELWRRRLEPVTVAWDGRLSDVRVRLPATLAGRRLRSWVDLDSGQRLPLLGRNGLDSPSKAEIEGRTYVEGWLPARGPGPIPEGYHGLTIEVAGVESTSFLISAPSRATPPPEQRRWGAFLPLHALRSRHSLGIGDLTDLRALTEWVASRGGSMIATLPLLAGFLDDHLFEASPYSPASRLFWNELFIDPEAAPELERSHEARELLSSPAYRRELRELGSRPLVDYRAMMAAKRRVLEALARTFWAEPGPRRQAFRAYARTEPRVFDYASFRAACERHGRSWFEWPARERQGRLPAEGGRPEAARYHAYVQWLAEQQLASTAERARSHGAALYFDMPLGVNPAGYDAWREPDAFLSGVSAGAPPDAFFKGGQNWGFRPLSPEGIRAQGYRYQIEVVRHLLKHAGVLRIDHAVGMHRLFVIPSGSKATEGVYIRYRPDEFYAIMCLESRRSGTVLVGEDLGTVPLSMTQALLRHGIQRTYVMQFELTKKRPGVRQAGARPQGAVRPPGVRPPTENALASFNTHDMAPFAAFWRALDVDLWLELGIVDRDEAAALRIARRAQRAALLRHLRSRGVMGPDDPIEDEVLRACLGDLAQSEARMVVLSMEDLWLETRPQNVPGTGTEYPNWRRRARRSFESFRRMPQVVDALREVDERRRKPPPDPTSPPG